MKSLSQTVTKTNCEKKLEALALMKKNGGYSAKDYLNKPFSIKRWVMGHSVITEEDEVTGEVREHEDDTITFETTTEDVVGTNSASVIREFNELVTAIEEDGLDLESVQFQLVQGDSNNGRKFTTLELVF